MTDVPPRTLDALLMAVLPRKPTAKIVIHSDQGSQFSNQE